MIFDEKQIDTLGRLRISDKNDFDIDLNNEEILIKEYVENLIDN